MSKYFTLVFAIPYLLYTISLSAGDCLSGNCVNGKGFAKYSDDQYIGEFKDGKPSGKGSYIWKDGTVYFGDFKNGSPDGKGEYIWPDGKKYVGEFKDGQPNGNGTLTYKNGESYQGVFENGALRASDDPNQRETVPEKGNALLPSLRSLLGLSNNKSEPNNCANGDCSNGKGKVQYGHQFVGDFDNGFFNGDGVYIWPDGSTYSGEFRDGRPHGMGTFTSPDGTSYEGDFKFGQPDGAGKFIDKDGKVYEGEFDRGTLVKPKKDIPNKKEKERYLSKAKPKINVVDQDAINPDSLEAEEKYYDDKTPFWKKKFSLASLLGGDKKPESPKKGKCISGNCINGKGTAKYDEEEYAGNFKDRFFNGKGKYTWPDGSVYEGDFRDGRPHGKGTYTKPDGSKHTGDFKFGKPDGKGKLTDKNGNVYEGDYAKGELVKPKAKISNPKEKEDYIKKGRANVRPVKKDAVHPKSYKEEEDYAQSSLPFYKKKILRSALIPGWTQWENGEKIKGSVFFGSFLFTAVMLYSWDKDYKSKRNDYNRSADLFLLYPNDLGAIGVGYFGVKNNFDNYQKVGREARQLSIGLVAIYLINVVDAMFFSKPSATAFYKDEGFQFSTEVQRVNAQTLENAYSIQYSWRF